MSRSWPDLHVDILYLIFEKLIDSDINHLSNCAGVCSSWRFVTNQLIKKLSPVILLADQGIERDEHGRFFVSPPNQGHYRLFNTRTRKTQETMLPELCDRWFRSAWPGWLFTANCKDPHKISLLNPLTKVQITLPRPWHEDNHLVKLLFKVVPSSSPLDSKCIFLGIFRNDIKFCRPGDETWSGTSTIDHCGTSTILNAVYHKGAFYIVGSNSYDDHDYIYRIHIDETTMTLSVKSLFFCPKLDEGYGRACYLVKLMGELLLLRLPQEVSGIATNTVKRMMAYKLQANDDDWARVRSLGGKHAIYVGSFHCLSIYVGDGNVHEECRRPNCVYFVDEFRLWKDTNSVYDFETDRFEELRFPRTNPLNWFGFQ